MNCNTPLQADLSDFNDLSDYRMYIQNRIEKIVSLIRTSVSDNMHNPIRESQNQPGDEFTELLAGLELLVSQKKALEEDVSRNRKLCQKLSQEMEKLTATISSISDAILILDVKDRIVFLNKAAENLIGYSSSEVKEKGFFNFVKIVDSQTKGNYDDFINACITSGRKVIRGIMITGNGDEKTVSAHGSIIDSSSGEVWKMLFLRDVTEQEKLEDELFNIHKLDSVSVFAGGIAHDFNNILTGITTNLFLAKMGIREDSDARKLIDEAQTAAFKATRLTKQLLMFSKGGGAQLKETASITEILEGCIGFCLKGLNVDYRLGFPEKIWQVDVDKGLIDQAFSNIILNAAESMPNGGTIDITAENINIGDSTSEQPDLGALPLDTGKYVKISIKDEGIGIPQKLLTTIFDPYFSTKENSTGLGLTTAYSIIRKHGGHITVQSQPGKGSLFSVYLPANIDQDDQRESLSALDGTGKSVLIMDDDALVRTVIEKLLKSAGFRVNTTTDGEEMLNVYKDAYYQNDPYSLVIMDLSIPGGIGGEEAVKSLKSFDPAAKVIIISGYSNNHVITGYRDFGFDGVLGKPFTINELSRVIQNVLAEKAS